VTPSPPASEIAKEPPRADPIQRPVDATPPTAVRADQPWRPAPVTIAVVSIVVAGGIVCLALRSRARRRG
jgi:hypothetical protein